jgi:hypothetical protein
VSNWRCAGFGFFKVIFWYMTEKKPRKCSLYLVILPRLYPELRIQGRWAVRPTVLSIVLQNAIVLLGSFAKLRKAVASFVMSVCPSVLSVCPSVLSVRTQQLVFHWTDFFFRKSAQKIQVSLTSDNNNGTLHKHLCTFMIISG